MMQRVYILAVSLLLLLAGPAMAQPKLGDSIPGFDTVLLNGTTLPAADLKGKPVLVVFWATWCGICRKEMPDLQALHERYRDQGFTLLAISIDGGQIEVDEFWKDHPYTFAVGMRTARHSELFGVTKYPPRFFLLDRQGVLRYQKNGAVVMEQLEQEIAALL